MKRIRSRRNTRWLIELTCQRNSLRCENALKTFPIHGEKITVTPEVGTELFRLGMLTDKVGQFHLLASGNPRPETTAVSPLYQITVGTGVKAGELFFPQRRKGEKIELSIRPCALAPLRETYS